MNKYVIYYKNEFVTTSRTKNESERGFTKNMFYKRENRWSSVEENALMIFLFCFQQVS